jgi:hypothetical protein
LSTDRSRAVSRGFVSATLTLLAVALAQSCGFPDHTFVSDEEFYGKAGKFGGGGDGGADASITGAGGNGQGGVNGGGPNGGGGGTGVGTGGETTIGGKREGGAPHFDAGIGGNSGTGGQGTLGDASVDAGLVCGVGLTACSGVCVDLLQDRNNCRNCGTVCTGTDVCTQDGCKPPCTVGLTECKPTGTTTNVCVDTAIDENNCGGCNKPCPGGFVCEGSKCLVDCGTQTRCTTQCYDTTTDDLHCGDCTTNCKNLGQVCSGGHCQPNCTAPFILCGGAGGTCVNPTNDDQNCNGCGKPCATGEGCINSKCTKLVEDCTNGSDDDRDNLIDCADPDCNAGYKCAATPAGWNGPIALWTGAAGTGPSCGASGGYPGALLNANAGLVIPPYTCPSCTCAPASGSTCDTLSFVFDTSTNCSDVSPWLAMDFPPSASCRATLQALCCAKNASARSIRLENPPTSYAHGSCTASQATPNFPNTSWSNEVLGCSAPVNSAGGCGGAQCLPKPAAPFGTSLCVFRSGISPSCPADYPVQKPGVGQQYYQSVLEGRSCTGCNCGSPTCGGTLTLSTNGTCSADSTVLNLGPTNSCTTIPGDPTQAASGMNNASDTRSYTYTNSGPVCGTAASTLNGAPKPDGAITVCCQSP